MAKVLCTRDTETGVVEDITGNGIIPGASLIKKIKTEIAIQKYIEICTSQKCKKNQKIEANFFEKFNNHLILKGIEFINDVKFVDLLEYQNILLKQMKPSSVNRRLCTLKNFFAMCERWEFTIKNQAKEIKKKRVEYNPYKNWTDNEFNQLISLTDGVQKSLLCFLWQTGCRPSEAKNLKWTDIDYANLQIIFNCGKNSTINRSFPMTDSLAKILHNLPIDSIYVFSKNKKQINNDTLYHYVKCRLNRLGFSHISVYGMRHTFAERLAKANVSPFYIQKLMGHSDMKTTSNYIHDDKNMLKEALNLIKYE